MSNFFITYTVTPEQTENFFNGLVKVIKYLFIFVPIILALIGVTYAIVQVIKILKEKKRKQILENKKLQREKAIREYEENQENKTKVIHEFTINKKYDDEIPTFEELVKNNNQEFYNQQIKKCTKCEKIFYDTLYKKYSNKYKLETQVYLRSMFPRMGAENDKIDIVFRDKQTNYPILLVEINDESHNRNKLRKMRDKDLKEFCATNNIKLQFLWTRYGCNEKSIYNLIDNKLKE